MPLSLSINGDESEIPDIAALRSSLAAMPPAQFAELWLRGHAESALCLLRSGDRAFLMFLRFSGDSGFTSRAGDAFADRADDLEFALSNGQHDSYPASWTISLEEAMGVFEHYFQTGQQSPSIHWHDDS